MSEVSAEKITINKQNSDSELDEQTKQALIDAAQKRPTTQSLKRVVITGTGAVSPAGIGVDILMNTLVNGVNNLSALDPERDGKFHVHVVGKVPEFKPMELGLTKKQARRWGKFIQFAAVAADEAMAQAHMDLEQEDLNHFACVFGSGIGGMEIYTNESIRLHERGAKRVTPLFIPAMIPNAAAGELAIRFGLKGECLTVVTACATGSHSIGEAYRLIRYGKATCALAGGTEESLSDMALAGFGNLGATTTSAIVDAASMPFDIRRAGFVPGEGAGAVVLESLEHAQARGAHIIAEITGFGSTGEGYHITSPDPTGEGIIRAMHDALDEAGFKPKDIGHLNAHGTATPINDRTESQALCKMVGEEYPDIPVYSVKGSTGHMLGAAGAIEAIVCALSVANSLVPPTVGFRDPDPECPVVVLKEAKTNYPQKVALSNSLGFGGHNACLAFSPFVA